MRCQMHNDPRPRPRNRCGEDAAFALMSPPPTLTPLTVYVCAPHADQLAAQGWWKILTLGHDDYEALDH